jgi:hypothetical protein
MRRKYLMLTLVLSGIPFVSWAQDTLNINFSGMDTLNDNNLYLSVYDVINETEVGRAYLVGSDDSTVAVEGITAGGTFNLDFFIDKNKNDRYDAPPDDQAWRVVLDSLAGGDTTITIWLNDTVYTDIDWENRLRLDFSQMDTIAGQNLYLSLRNQDGDREIVMDSVEHVTSAFTYDFFDVYPDSSYQVVFFADQNDNYLYDTTDKAWLIYLDHIKGDTVVPFTYNTDFANNIVWFVDSTGNNNDELYKVTLNLTNMTPHVGQMLSFYVEGMESDAVTDSLSMIIDTANFTVEFDSLMNSADYNLDFYADMNGNGSYDAPPTDHAWRIVLNDIQGDTTINFVHNTDFTDIFGDTTAVDTGNYSVTVMFTGYTSNVGQNFTVYLKNPDSNQIVDSLTIAPLDTADFTVVFDSVMTDSDYNIDFFVDANSNGSLDAPPDDQSWRILLVDVDADTTINFVYDTNYTDITVVVTGVDEVGSENGFFAYPNPVKDELTLNMVKGATGLSIYTVTGALILQQNLTPADRIVKLNVSHLKPGLYLLRLNNGSTFSQQKFLKE